MLLPEVLPKSGPALIIQHKTVAAMHDHFTRSRAYGEFIQPNIWTYKTSVLERIISTELKRQLWPYPSAPKIRQLPHRLGHHAAPDRANSTKADRPRVGDEINFMIVTAEWLDGVLCSCSTGSSEARGRHDRCEAETGASTPTIADSASGGRANVQVQFAVSAHNRQREHALILEIGE